MFFFGNNNSKNYHFVYCVCVYTYILYINKHSYIHTYIIYIISHKFCYNSSNNNSIEL